MSFQRARKTEQIRQRRQEILEAAWELFAEGGLEMVTFSAIAKRISFTRQTIYTYYKSREEVLLDILGIYVRGFYESVKQMFPPDRYVTQHEFCKKIVDHLLAHKKMVFLFSLSSTLEQNSRYENILAFNRIMAESIPLFRDILRHQCADVADKVIAHFCITIMIYISSIYKLMNRTPLQTKALREAVGDMKIPSEEETMMSSLLLLTASFHFIGDENAASKPETGR